MKNSNKQIDIYKSIRKEIPKPTGIRNGKTPKQERKQVRDTLNKLCGRIDEEENE